jgi:hypothetical protein
MLQRPWTLLESCAKSITLNEISMNTEGEKALIAAILTQAYCDACSLSSKDDPEGAKRFIDANNKLFCDYCYLLDLDPVYTAEMMQKRIINKSTQLMKYFQG